MLCFSLLMICFRLFVWMFACCLVGCIVFYVVAVFCVLVDCCLFV